MKRFKIESTVELPEDWDVIKLGTTIYALLALAKRHSKVAGNRKLLDMAQSTLQIHKEGERLKGAR